MSTHGGLHWFNDAEADYVRFVLLSQSLRSLAQGYGCEMRLGQVAMVYLPFQSTPESARERQPLVSSGGQVLAWDGRLDNRGELLVQLRQELDQELMSSPKAFDALRTYRLDPAAVMTERQANFGGSPTDAAIVLAGYRKWGLSLLSLLIGDFTVVLWDPVDRTLLLARDAFGTRRLFYHLSSAVLVWCSELAPLASLPGIDVTIDDNYIAGHLIRTHDPTLTPYQGIRAVAPGTAVIARRGGVESHRFWSLDPQREINYADDADYEHHFRWLFREAVRCRLRAAGPVWAELSGGTDSSSIVCVGDDIIAQGQAETSGIQTVSHIYDEAHTSDEREYISLIERCRQGTGIHIREDDYRILLSVPDDVFFPAPAPYICSRKILQREFSLMKAAGVTVLLSGVGGDHVLWSEADSTPELADFLVQFKPLSLHRAARDWSRARHKPYLNVLRRGILDAALPRKWRVRLKQGPELPSWFNREFVKRTNLRDRSLGSSDMFSCQLPSRRVESSRLWDVISWVSVGFYPLPAWINMTFPFLHRPLVEFCMAIPVQQKLRPGETRSVHRRALRGLVPREVLRRTDKRGPEEAFHRAVAREWPRLTEIFENARVYDRAYVNKAPFRHELDKARHGVMTSSVSLILTVSLELWLRGLERWQATGVRACPDHVSELAPSLVVGPV
jgi:asparagine synthase (glutamine-hydrolysing)